MTAKYGLKPGTHSHMIHFQTLLYTKTGRDAESFIDINILAGQTILKKTVPPKTRGTALSLIYFK